jgi:hypothetical protein
MGMAGRKGWEWTAASLAAPRSDGAVRRRREGRQDRLTSFWATAYQLFVVDQENEGSAIDGVF